MGANKNGQRIMCSVICTPPVEPAARRGWGIKALEIQKRHPKRCLPIRKHRGAREKRYSFGYAVFLILALMK